jgi:EAL and modified HD-GYP domain-containing signal transduction protein
VSAVCLARQAIYDRDLVPCGYELLYRSGPAAVAADGAGDTAMSAHTLQAALTDIGLDVLVGRRPVWVNLGASALTADLVAALPPERTVVEVLETAGADGQVVDAVASMRADGYRIALDDFVFRPELAPLVELADVVKLDALALDGAALAEQAELLRPYGVALLAEKVETHDVLDDCRALGFTLFQGYFLSRPRVLSAEGPSTEAVLRMRLLAELHAPDADFERLGSVIAADVTLSYRMLRYVNSAFVGLSRPVASVRQALVELGVRRVRSWATLLLLTDAAGGRRELAETALQRGAMCEALAAETRGDPEAAFTTGLLSVVDALLGCSISEAVADLPLSADVEGALLRRDGPLGDLLTRVVAYERGEFAAATRAPLDAELLTRAYVEAIAWAAELMGDTPAPEVRRAARRVA